MMFHRHKLHINRIGHLSISVFFYTFTMAMIAPLFPLFIKSVGGSNAEVGLVYGATSFIGLIFCVLSGEIMQKYGRRFVLKSASAVMCMSLIVYTFVNNVFDLFIVESIRVVAVTSAVVALGVLVRTFSKRDDLDSSESKYYTFTNIAWFLAPALCGIIYDAYGMDAIFLSAALIIVISYLSIHKVNFSDHRNHKGIDFQYIRAHVMHKVPVQANSQLGLKSICKEVKHFVKNRNLLLIYLVSFGLYMIFSIKWIYLPVILDSFNASKTMIGLMTASLVIPLIIFEIPLTRISKKVGSKGFMIAGFVIESAAITTVYFFYSQYSAYLLFLAGSIGAAMIEPFKEAYILKCCPPNKVNVFFGIFKTSQYLGYTVAPILASAIIMVLGIKSMFVLIGPMLLVFAVVAAQLKSFAK